jgi:hypothetical protein
VNSSVDPAPLRNEISDHLDCFVDDRQRKVVDLAANHAKEFGSFDMTLVCDPPARRTVEAKLSVRFGWHAAAQNMFDDLPDPRGLR